MSSNRLAIAQGLQLLLAGITNPATSSPLYAGVKLGAYFGTEMATLASWAEVTPASGQSGPHGSGGVGIGWRIEDAFTLEVTSGWDYETDSTFAVTACLTAMDVLLPILHSHVVIPSPANPTQPVASVWSVSETQPDRAMPVRIPPGHIYLLWKVSVTVKQQYGVVIQSP